LIGPGRHDLEVAVCRNHRPFPRGRQLRETQRSSGGEIHERFLRDEECADEQAKATTRDVLTLLVNGNFVQDWAVGWKRDYGLR
jgi:hypothetical protein